MKKLFVLWGFLLPAFGAFAQPVPPTPVPPTPTLVQGTLFSLPGRGWQISNSGDVYREGDSAGLTAWTPAGGAMTLVSENPDFGVLGIVNAGLAVYALENSSPFTTLLTAVNLATGKVDGKVVKSAKVMNDRVAGCIDDGEQVVGRGLHENLVADGIEMVGAENPPAAQL